MVTLTPAPRTTTARRRWPLLAIGASAGTATWSGWVGLGQLTGFGVVHPLPGIADGFTINTAVTLPIGVEAYAMYALSVATSSRPLPERTRRYAWASSAAALLLGMAGQVAFHVMTAGQPVATQQASPAVHLAPWWVIALVSCLPVLVLGAASLLWHLAADVAESAQPTAVASQREVTADPIEPIGPLPDPAWWPIPSPSASGSDRSSNADPLLVRDDAPESSGSRSAAGHGLTARPEDVARVREAIAAGDLPAKPAASAIRTLLSISPAYARAARDAYTATAQNPEERTAESPAPEPDQISSPTPAPHQNAEQAAAETPEDPFQQHIPAVTKKAEPRKQPLTTEEPDQKEQERHTYAVGLP